MGTNYYAVSEPCRCCGRSDGRVHIGKSSYGWKFLFAPFERANGESIASFQGWRTYLADKRIVDEYGQTVTLDALVELVESKQAGGLCADTATDAQYGSPPADRFRHEVKDADGYRIATTADFS